MVVVNGGDGNDRIETDLGRDTVLIGGAGSDRFALTDPVATNGKPAEIHGGDATVDIIQLGLVPVDVFTPASAGGVDKITDFDRPAPTTTSST